MGCAEFKFYGRVASNFRVRQAGHGMVDEGQDGVGGPARSHAGVMDKSSEVAHEERIDVLGTITFMAANYGDVVGNAKPVVELLDNGGGEGAARI